jgi:putative SOS response-associated peptidase YedK
VTISYRFLDDPGDVANYFEVRAPKVAGDTFANPGARTSIVRRNPALTTNEYAEDREAVTAAFGLPAPYAQVKGRSIPTHCLARVETVWEKPAFRSLWEKKQRCLVPIQYFAMTCDGGSRFGKWRRVYASDSAPMGLAGLWKANRTRSGAMSFTFAILTTIAEWHPLISQFYDHDLEKRMPVILSPYQYEVWLSDAPDDELDFIYQCPPLPPFTGSSFVKCRDQYL